MLGKFNGGKSQGHNFTETRCHYGHCRNNKNKNNNNVHCHVSVSKETKRCAVKAWQTKYVQIQSQHIHIGQSFLSTSTLTVRLPKYFFLRTVSWAWFFILFWCNPKRRLSWRKEFMWRQETTRVSSHDRGAPYSQSHGINFAFTGMDLLSKTDTHQRVQEVVFVASCWPHVPYWYYFRVVIRQQQGQWNWNSLRVDAYNKTT